METELPKALLDLIDNPTVTDICLSSGKAEADFGQGLVLLDEPALSEPELSKLARELIELGGRRLDQASPFADVSLPVGIRVHAVLKSDCSEKTMLSLRLHSTDSPDLSQMLNADFTHPAKADLIRQIVRNGESFLIAGATGTGKTTLLRAMLKQAGGRVIAIEDVTELYGQNIIGLRTKAKNIEGQGEVTLEDLVRQALRMRPDRICIGEVRGSELLPMLQALNTGHRGATTLHANSLAQIPERLISIASQQGLSESVLSRLVVSAFDWVIFLDLQESKRKVAGIGRFALNEGVLQVVSELRMRKLALA